MSIRNGTQVFAQTASYAPHIGAPVSELVSYALARTLAEIPKPVSVSVPVAALAGAIVGGISGAFLMWQVGWSLKTPDLGRIAGRGALFGAGMGAVATGLAAAIIPRLA